MRPPYELAASSCFGVSFSGSTNGFFTTTAIGRSPLLHADRRLLLLRLRQVGTPAAKLTAIGALYHPFALG